MAKALVVCGNNYEFKYPSAGLCSEETVGDALITIGIDASYCGIKTLALNLYKD